MESEGAIVEGFVNRFLKGEVGIEPETFETDADYPEWSDEKWIEWDVPVLG